MTREKLAEVLEKVVTDYDSEGGFRWYDAQADNIFHETADRILKAIEGERAGEILLHCLDGKEAPQYLEISIPLKHTAGIVIFRPTKKGK